MLSFLDGYKTYISSALGALVVGLFFAQVIDDKMATGLLAMLGFGSAAALKSAIKKVE